MVFMVSVLLKKEQWFHVGDTFVTLVLSGDPEKKWQESRKPEVQPAPGIAPPELRYECPQIRPMITPQNSNEFDTKKWPRILKP